MRCFGAIAALCVAALFATPAAVAQTIQRLEPGVTVTRQLSNDEVHQFRSAVTGNAIIVVVHVGRGTVLTACRGDCGNSDNRLFRTASWRGPEHLYTAVLPIEDDTLIEIEPDETVAPTGQYRITVSEFPRSHPNYEAEQAMTLGADRHLRYYFGEADEREEAAAYFELATQGFAAAGNKPRLADAYFEAATAHYYLGNNRQAYGLYQQAQDVWQEIGDERGVASAENQRGLISQLFADSIDPDDRVTAIELFESAAQRRLGLGDEFFYAQAVNNLGIVYRELGDGRRAVRHFEEALTAWQGSLDLLSVDPAAVDFAGAQREPWLNQALIAMMNLGWAHDHAARPDLAEQYFRQALALSDFLERGRMAAEIRSNYGALMYRIGNLQAALQLLEESLVYFESEAGDEVWSAQVNNNLGLVYMSTGDTERALASFNEALRLRTVDRDPVGRAETLRNIMMLQVETGNASDALEMVAESVDALASTPSLVAERAHLHDAAGRAYLATGRPESALEHHDRAVELYVGINHYRGEARARTNRANAYHALGRDIAALPEFDVALDLAQQIESLPDQFRILTDMAQFDYDRQEFRAAYERAGKAISISNRLREQLVHPALLREYASVQQDAYDVLIGSAISVGDIEAAWIASDRSRAPRFTELLRQTDAVIDSLSSESRVRLRNLRLRVAALAEQRSELLALERQEAAGQVRRELVPLLNQMDALTAETAQPATGRGPHISLRDLQAELDARDLLLEFHLSPLGSGVWHIRSESISYSPLPSLDEINERVTRLRQSLQVPASDPDAQLRQLSSMLFGQNAGMLADAERLIVIPDGSLHMIPFAALPDPSQGMTEPLIVSHDVSYLPSSAALIELRRRSGEIGSGIAVLADPVFDPEDARVQVEAGAAAGEPVASLMRGPDAIYPQKFQRLPGTRQESRKIVESAVDIDVRIVLDTDANRDFVLDGELDDYRILHFATHGVLDIEEPALSGLVLSGVTGNGLPRSRFLLTQDIVSLDLKADLVVLSGCDTGMGRAVRAEGLLSLSRAF
jgi:tetratricopeptide (TPR) repeat protein/CHAT domain-containing protein